MKVDALAKEQNTTHDSEAVQRRGIDSSGFADMRPSAVTQRKLMQVTQRATQDEEEPEKHAALDQTKLAQRKTPPEDEKTAQAKASADTAESGGADHLAAGRDGLPTQLKAGIEAMSGMSMDHVKVHYNSDRPAQLQARAYAQGSDIHVAPGQEQHLPHEAWHVVQQAQGRVRPTLQMKLGVPLNDDAGLESEADVMGAKALQTGAAGAASGTASVQMKPMTANFSSGLPVQLLPAVFSRAAFANPAAYLAGRFPDTQIDEDAGSGGIMDEPVRKLVLELARAPRREIFAERLDAAGENGQALATTLRQSVFDRTTAQTWVIQNTLAISAVVPWALTIENAAMHDAPQGPVHTFHRDHGKVVLTDAALVTQGVNSVPERNARRAVLNGPGGTGWVRGHNGVLNKKHRFIDHVHVDKDAPHDAAFEIYDADNAAVGQTAENFNLANRAGFNDANDGRVNAAAVAVEGDAKRVAWEQYEATLPPEVDEVEAGGEAH